MRVLRHALLFLLTIMPVVNAGVPNQGLAVEPVTIGEFHKRADALSDLLLDRFPEALQEQSKLLASLDDRVLQSLASGRSRTAVNVELSALQSHGWTGPQQQYVLLGSNDPSVRTTVALYQLGLRGPTVFRVFDGQPDAIKKVFSSEASADDYELTRTALEIVILSLDDESTHFITVSDRTDSGVRGSIIEWLYSRASGSLQKGLRLTHVKDLEVRHDEEARMLVVRYCACEDEEYASSCLRRIEDSYSTRGKLRRLKHLVKNGEEGQPH